MHLVLESGKETAPQLFLWGKFCQRFNEYIGKVFLEGIKIKKLQILFSVLGDPRTNQNPALLTFGILFFRWHNVVASRVQHEHPDWSDEDVFQRARRVVIATLQVITQNKPKHVVGVVTARFLFQNIIFYEYLPGFLGEELPEYDGYNQDVHPGISHAFQSAAFRFGHSLIPPGIYRRDNKCNYKPTQFGFMALRLCSTWWDSNVRQDCVPTINFH